MPNSAQRRFFSPDSSDDSEDDEQQIQLFPIVPGQDNKFVKSCHGFSSLSILPDLEESLDNSQQNYSGEENKLQWWSMDDGSSSFTLNWGYCGRSRRMFAGTTVLINVSYEKVEDIFRNMREKTI
uniref:Uncharacterized protein n=1 Tax=Globodera rostochiensis TaxID=31243 RepID=A0A914IAI4_GLORO